MVQLSHPYTANGKNIALTVWTFVGKVMSLFVNMLSRFVIDFLLRSTSFIFIYFKNFYFYFILLYNTVLVLPYIDMNLPWVE